MATNFANTEILDSAGSDASSGSVFPLHASSKRNTKGEDKRGGNGFFCFVAELRRRRVGRAATLYTVAFWLICQVVDVIAPAIGLPGWMLKLIVILGLILFPIVIVLSWLFDLTADGLVADVEHRGAAPGRRLRTVPLLVDGAMLIAALVIGVQLATGISFSTDSEVAGQEYRIAVEPIRVIGTAEGDSLSELLLMSLQHALSRTPGVTVVDSRDTFLTRETRRLCTVVIVEQGLVRVTARLVESLDGTIIWSKAFDWSLSSGGLDSSGLAERIALSLPVSNNVVSAGETSDG